VKRVLITGMSGTGKSTVIKALATRGYKAVDADYNGLSGLVSISASSDRSGLGVEQDWI
jgi:predicted ATPase